MHVLPRRSWALAVASLLLAAAAPAQQPTAPFLRLRVADPAVQTRLAAALHADGFVAGPRCVLTVGIDPATSARVVASSTAERELPAGTWGEVEVLPAAAVAVCGDLLAEARRTWRPRVELALRQVQFGAGTGRQLWDDVEALLPTIASVQLRIDGDPVRDATGTTWTLAFTAVKDSPLQRWCTALQPGRGAPDLVADGWPLALRIDLQPEGVANALAPFVALFAGWQAHDDAARADNAAGYAEAGKHWDGAFAAGFRGDALAAVVGVRDAVAAAAALVSPARLQRAREQAAARGVQVEHAPDALVHRGVPVLRTRSTTKADTGGLPAAFVVHEAVAGRWLVVDGAAEAGAAACTGRLDQVLDDRLPRRALADGAVLQLELDLARLRRILAAAEPAAADPALPAHVRLLLLGGGATTRLRLELH